MLEIFFSEHRVMVIPRIQNKITDSLTYVDGAFKILVYPNMKYEIEVVNRHSILYNSKYWQFSEDHLKIIFL